VFPEELNSFRDYQSFESLTVVGMWFVPKKRLS